MKDKKGFTLAEVLITLGIIGVVAALTIPTLIANNQKTQYVTALKKAYTEFNQALIQMAADNGCIGDLQCTGFFDTDKDNQSLGTELVKYFKVAENCESSSSGTSQHGCFPDRVKRNYDGTGNSMNNFEDLSSYRFVTSAGMAFEIYNWQNNCQTSNSNGVSNNMTQICGQLYLDVNGLKGPNNYGRDIFFFYITNGRGPLLYQAGGADISYEVWRDNSGNPYACYPVNPDGAQCAGRVMEEGWKMNY